MMKFKDPMAPLVPAGHSQIKQDLFVIAMTRGVKGGSFLEIGAGDPVFVNNTHLLESKFDYRGISVEIVTPDYNKFFPEWYKEIKIDSWPDAVESLDALPDWIRTKIEQMYPLNDYANHHNAEAKKYRDELLSRWKDCRPASNLITQDAFDIDYSALPKFFTYLQVDIDPPEDNLKILKKICEHIRFAVITFEHDYYRNTPGSDLALIESRKFLTQQGYCLVADKVENFEDWWVDPACVSVEILNCYMKVDDRIKKPDEILFVEPNKKPY